jgi:hypothetical protein
MARPSSLASALVAMGHSISPNSVRKLRLGSAELSAFDAADQTGDRGSRRLHHHGIRRKITAERESGIESFLRDGNCDSFSVARGAIMKVARR